MNRVQNNRFHQKLYQDPFQMKARGPTLPGDIMEVIGTPVNNIIMSPQQSYSLAICLGSILNFFLKAAEKWCGFL